MSTTVRKFKKIKINRISASSKYIIRSVIKDYYINREIISIQFLSKNWVGNGCPSDIDSSIPI